jgi:hypothetical protein
MINFEKIVIIMGCIGLMIITYILTLFNIQVITSSIIFASALAFAIFNLFKK